MADDTGTDWLTLADRLDELATDRRWDCWNKHGDGSLDVPEGYDPSPDCCDAADGANALRAAADGLRQYAAITAAIGDPDELRYHARGDVADTGGGDDLQARLRAIADAAASLSPTPTPDHCPTCDSDDVEACGAAYYDEHRHICPDAWHDSQG